MAEAAGKCADKALQHQADFRDELIGHKVGGGKESAANGYWHIDYKHSKDEGWHRHDWSEAAKDKAGAEYATSRVRQAKEASLINKTTSESGTSYNVGGLFKVSIGIASTVDHEVSGSKGGDKRESTEQGPLTEAKAKEIYDKAYAEAKGNPNLSTVNPDILCEKGQPKCSTSFSHDYANEDYHSQGGNKTGDNKSSGGNSVNTSGSTSSGGNSGNKNPTTPPSKSTTEVDVDIDHSAAGTFAGDPSPVTKPGEIIATWDENMVDSSISRCLIEEIKEQLSQDMDKTYNPDGVGLTPEQRRKEAQGLLRKGICNAKFYGSAFCQKHKTFKLTGNSMQDPPKEKVIDVEPLQDIGTINYGNPADHKNKKPIDFNRIPTTDPNTPAYKPTVVRRVN